VALSREPRYGGHSLRTYRVAEHCVILARHARKKGLDTETQFDLLIHDAAEAYLRDIPGPIKKKLDNYNYFEARIEQAVRIAFACDWFIQSDVIKTWDRRILVDERTQVMRKTAHKWSYIQGLDALGVKIEFWSERRARVEWLREFYRFRPALKPRGWWWKQFMPLSLAAYH